MILISDQNKILPTNIQVNDITLKKGSLYPHSKKYIFYN